MLRLFDRSYSRLIVWGLIVDIWFAALFQAAHNLWAASLLFGEVTLLGLIFCIGRARDSKPIKLPLLFSLTLFLTALRLSLGHAYDLDTAWLEFWGWFFTVLIFYLFINVIESQKDLDRFFTIAGLIVIPLAVHCIWQCISPPIPPEGLPPTVGLFGYGLLEIPLTQKLTGHAWTFRYGQWEIHANLINSVVLAGFVLYWTLFYWEKMRSDRRYAPCFIACLTVLGFARSWWAIVALSLGYLIYYREHVARLTQHYRKTAGVLLGLCLFFLIAVFYVKTHHRVERTVDEAHYHANSRWHYWQSALAMWQTSPWTGIGLGGYATAYPSFKIDHGENTLFAHGILPQLASETGILGGIALLVLIWSGLRMRFTRSSAPPTYSTSVFEATLGVILCFSLISINLDFLLNKVMLFVVLAAILAPYATKTYRVRPLWLGTTGCGLILLTAFWLNLFVASRLYISGLYWERQGNMPKAVELYNDAIQVEPYHAESYWRLSELYELAYQTTGLPGHLAAAQAYRHQAIRYKKDIRFFKSK